MSTATGRAQRLGNCTSQTRDDVESSGEDEENEDTTVQAGFDDFSG
jgi:hypothetical protein